MRCVRNLAYTRVFKCFAKTFKIYAPFLQESSLFGTSSFTLRDFWYFLFIMHTSGFALYIFIFSFFPSGQNRQKKKNSLKEYVFVNSAQKYTPTDCFFGDFAHWVARLRLSTGVGYRPCKNCDFTGSNCLKIYLKSGNMVRNIVRKSGNYQQDQELSH